MRNGRGSRVWETQNSQLSSGPLCERLKIHQVGFTFDFAFETDYITIGPSVAESLKVGVSSPQPRAEMQSL